MSRMIFCKKLQREAAALERQPYPGELGKKIHEEISAEAWAMWVNHQTMLINEYRLSLLDQSSRDFLVAEMQKFLFGEGSEKPSGFVEPEKK